MNGDPLARSFVALKDINDWCREHGIQTQLIDGGPSFEVSYLLGLSPFDPIIHDLFSETLLGTPADYAPPRLQLCVDREHREQVLEYLKTRWDGLPVHVDTELGSIPHPDMVALGVNNKERRDRPTWDFRTETEGVRLLQQHLRSLPTIELPGTKRLSAVASHLQGLGYRHLDELPLPNPTAKQQFPVTQLADLLGYPSAADLCAVRAQTWTDLVVARAARWAGAYAAGLPALYGSHADEPAPLKISDDTLAANVSAILEDTRGLLVFQEQFTRIAHEIVGIEQQRLRRFRQAVSYGPNSRRNQARSEFDRCMGLAGHSSTTADELFELLQSAGAIAFSKAHALAEARLVWVLTNPAPNADDS